MATTSSTSSTTTSDLFQSLTQSRSTTVENPKGVLDSSAFMKLLLTELQYQDPTSPMDTDKMLTQTSQLTALEAQNELKTTMKTLAETFSATSQYNATSMIGKVASLGSGDITLTKGSPVSFGLRFTEAANDIKITIKDANNKVVATHDVGDSTSSYEALSWDGQDSNGNLLASGTYKISATYTDSTGSSKSADVAYMVDSIRFSNGTAEAKLGSSYVALSKITEIYE